MADDDSRPAQLADFLRFVGDARTFLEKNRLSEKHPDVARIRDVVEEHSRDEQERATTYQKYESALYEDAPAIVTLWSFFRNYDPLRLQRYRSLTAMELRGLSGDFHPTAILGRSLLGKAALLLSAFTVWSGIIGLVSAANSGNPLPALLGPSLANGLAGFVWVAGMFIVLWYVIRMTRNRKQVAFLASLSRALTLYLEHGLPRNE